MSLSTFPPEGFPNLDDAPDDLTTHAGTFAALQRYCELRSSAARLRLAGQIQQAQEIERELADIYSNLPAWAQW